MKDHVPEEIYRQAERQARVAQLKLSEMADEKNLALTKKLFALLQEEHQEIIKIGFERPIDAIKCGFFYLVYELLEKSFGMKISSTQKDLMQVWRGQVDAIITPAGYSKEELIARVKERISKGKKN